MVTSVTACRVCRGRIESILRFGEMPLANRYPKSIVEPEPRFPLEVVLCRDCGCVQLAHSIDPAALFSEYLYTSSTSGTLAAHFDAYARSTVEKLKLQPDIDFIVGIGGNDGPLERAYQTLGFRVLNVEPAKNIAALSMANRVPTLNAWFTEATAEAIVREHGHAALVTCNNCFAHMPDPHAAVRAIKTLLQLGGWFVSEEGYWLDAVRGNHFDRIYHEHVFYWSVRALRELFRQHGLDISHVEFNASQGGSVRVFVANGVSATCSAVGAAIEQEQAYGLFDPPTYADWTRHINAWRGEARGFLTHRNSLCCYGVPAKFAMLSEQLRFSPTRIRYAVEDSPIKIGRYTPGARIPICDRGHFTRHPTKACIITAANYADRIITANPQFKGQWLVLTPEPKVMP